jgi:DNA-binding MarR family transcriptional regulator/GNAT superfamily N-acetyltransferase
MTTDTIAGELRRFTRSFTQITGLLRNRLYDVDLSLTDARVLFEIAHEDGITAKDIRLRLGLDGGYLSRVIARLRKLNWVTTGTETSDKRARPLALTYSGRALFNDIDQRSTREMEELTAHLDPAQKRSLSAALMTVSQLLAAPHKEPHVVIRPHRIGDMGWIVHRHGLLYAQNQGWDITFEGAVARIAADFIENQDPSRQQCFVCEIDGQIAGSATIVELDEAVAQLRIVYVEPWARGRGVGETLVQACMSFASDAGYSRMKLWTNEVLKPARRLYQRLDFALIESKPHRAFGVDLVSEVWERDL